MNSWSPSVRHHRLAAHGRSNGSSIIASEDQDWDFVAPGSDRAKAIIKKYRPALFGYAGFWAEKILEHMYQLHSEHGLMYRVDPRKSDPIRNGMQGDDRHAYKTLRRLTDLDPTATGVHRSLLLTIAIEDMAALAADETIRSNEWVQANNADVPLRHLTDLLELFYHLDVVELPQGGWSHNGIYGSPAHFVLSGIDNADRLSLKNLVLATEVLKPSADPDFVINTAVHTSLITPLASISTLQAEAVEDAISVGNYWAGARTSSAGAMFDPLSVRVLVDPANADLARVVPVVPLRELLIPRSIQPTGTADDYDLTTAGPNVSSLGNPSDPTSRAPLGCIGLGGSGPEGMGTSVVEQHSLFFAAQIRRFGIVRQLQIGAPPGGSTKPPPSLAHRMVESGVYASDVVMAEPHRLAAPLPAPGPSRKSDGPPHGGHLL